MSATLRAIDALLTYQALVIGRISDRLTGRAPRSAATVSLEQLGANGRPAWRLALPTRVFANGAYAIAGDPLSALPVPTGGETLDLRLVTRCPGYFEERFDFSLDAAALALQPEQRTVLGLPLVTRRLAAPLLEHDVQLLPLPVALSGRVVEADDPTAPVNNAQVRVTGVAGARLVGRLHFGHGAEAVAIQDETEGDDVPVVRDLPAGAMSLAAGTPPQPAGQVLRVASDPGATEYVTIAAGDRNEFREPGLLFPHSRATTRIQRVTLATAAGEPAGGRAIEDGAPRAARVLRLTNTTNLAAGQVVRIGDGATREFQRIASVVPFGPVDTDADGFFTIAELPLVDEVIVRVEHADFAPLAGDVVIDYRQPVNERTFALSP